MATHPQMLRLAVVHADFVALLAVVGAMAMPDAGMSGRSFGATLASAAFAGVVRPVQPVGPSVVPYVNLCA